MIFKMAADHFDFYYKNCRPIYRESRSDRLLCLAYICPPLRVGRDPTQEIEHSKKEGGN